MRLSHPFLLAWLNVVFLLSFASTALGKPIKPNSSIFADLVLVNGVVASIDEAIVGAQAIAVSGHLIMGVGSDEEMSVFVGEDTQIIDLDGRFAMPGFIEGHGHFMSLGRAKQILDLTDLTNWDQAVSRVAAAADRAQSGSGSLVGVGIRTSGNRYLKIPLTGYL